MPCGAKWKTQFVLSIRIRPPLSIGAGAPAINVAETKDAFEVTAELPGVDEKDIKVSLDNNQLVISGEKKAESTKEEKDWHVEERSYGSFYRSMSLPFEPEAGAVDAHFDKGVLRLTIKKPAKAIKTTKTIDIKTGTAEQRRRLDGTKERVPWPSARNALAFFSGVVNRHDPFW